MKYLLSFLLFLSILFLSCDREYDGENRIQFKGKIINEFNQPLANQSIKVYSSYDDNYTEIDRIGIGNTDSNGNYSILIPQSKHDGHYNVYINEEVTSTSELTNTTFVNIKNISILNYSMQLPTAKLFLKANLSNLNLTFNNTTSQKSLEEVQFIGEIANEWITFEDEMPSNEYLKKVKKNQTIEVKYKVYNYATQTSTIFSEFIIIGNSENIYHTIIF
ncbi:hypothetical protein [Flavobacterium urocaniciphilum]|uniref:Uncharacterized protein n=1 Tax=Flavobacterium urocaniciphilum TaxID=1299341 RepID=A0A1H8Z8H6_9FLAO|nr:hypothetical protein [Flavobacterium urocaniciphilum]SEP60759.1 hypothetical protein SAMN05444005_101556 [Flavobacterium urocaniciphilum]